MYQRQNGPTGLSLLDRYFLRPCGSFDLDGIDTNFNSLTYTKYYELFRLSDIQAHNINRANHYIERIGPVGSARKLVIRRLHKDHVTKIQLTNPSHKERFYLAALLKHRPMWDWADTTIVNDEEQGSFQQAACELGLFALQSEAEAAICEGIEKLLTPHQLRNLFVWMLLDGQVIAPMDVWNRYVDNFSQDHMLRFQSNPNLAIEHTLSDINLRLEEHGKSLEDFGLPVPTQHSSEIVHELEKWAPEQDSLATRASFKINQMNHEQLSFFHDLFNAINHRLPYTPFISGGAGRGKSFVIEAALDLLRSKGFIAIATATSAFAAQIYPGGKTAHSVFKVSLFSCICI